MAEAKIKLPNGTEVAITGSPEDIAKVVSLYNEGADTASAPKKEKPAHRRANHTPQRDAEDAGAAAIDLAEIINKVKDCDEYELIESNILDDPDVVNRVLLPLYINETYFNSSPPMTTGEISQILKQLRVPISTANVSTAISRKANSYVTSDGVRKKGAIIRYSLNRRGVQFFESVLSGEKVSEVRATKRPASTKAKKPVEVSEKPVSAKKPPSSGRKDVGYKPKFNNQLDLLGLKDFISQFELRNNTEYLVAFCKFLEEKVGVDSITGHDIFTCFSEMKAVVKIPGSFMNTLRNAQNRDHVITYERGFVDVVLTPRGENHFNHEIAKRKKLDVNEG